MPLATQHFKSLIVQMGRWPTQKSIDKWWLKFLWERPIFRGYGGCIRIHGACSISPCLFQTGRVLFSYFFQALSIKIIVWKWEWVDSIRNNLIIVSQSVFKESMAKKQYRSTLGRSWKLVYFTHLRDLQLTYTRLKIQLLSINPSTSQ